MTDDRKAGFALIAGTLGGILTMAIHPTGSAHLTAAEVAHLSLTSGLAHSIAMVSSVVMFLGFCGFHRRIAAPDSLSFAALVTYAFAAVAILIATAVSGFIIPGIMKHMVRDSPETLRQWQILIDGIFQINQAFARIFSVAASASILLWSVSALRNGGLSRTIATYGIVIGPVTIVGIAIGHLRLDVHGMAAVVIGQAIWFLLVGKTLLAATEESQPAPGKSANLHSHE